MVLRVLAGWIQEFEEVFEDMSRDGTRSARSTPLAEVDTDVFDELIEIVLLPAVFFLK